MHEIIHDLFINLILFIICNLSKKVYLYFKSISSNPNSIDLNTINIKKTKKQFHAFLIMAFISFVLRNLASNMFKTIFTIAFLFSLIFLWGAFDVVFSVADKIENDSNSLDDNNRQ
mgnify:CR=1 FL=1